MSYATIEEAWGGLGKQTPPASPRIAAPKQAVEKPAPGVTFEDGRKYVRAVYAQYGIKGVFELLGVDISKKLCGTSGKRRIRTAERKSVDWFTLTPEKMLLLVVALFGAIALVDGFGSKTTQGGSPPPW